MLSTQGAPSLPLFACPQVMNAICLQSALEALGVETRVQTAIEMQASGARQQSVLADSR